MTELISYIVVTKGLDVSCVRCECDGDGCTCGSGEDFIGNFQRGFHPIHLNFGGAGFYT